MNSGVSYVLRGWVWGGAMRGGSAGRAAFSLERGRPIRLSEGPLNRLGGSRGRSWKLVSCLPISYGGGLEKFARFTDSVSQAGNPICGYRFIGTVSSQIVCLRRKILRLHRAKAVKFVVPVAPTWISTRFSPPCGRFLAVCLVHAPNKHGSLIQ
jgi:hypothetical protein